MSKEALRRKLRIKRLAMKQVEVEAKSRTICDKLLAEIAEQKFQKIHIYKSLTSLNEVDTKDSFNQLVERNLNKPGVEIILGSNRENAPLPRQKFDLIIVPCLGFDKDNYRLGWGGGWYDRFLAKQPRALKIGLCFQNGFLPGSLPHEPHDIPMDKVITEVY
ncbi:MAG TPA: 5-formyltetrahydrofolate cyclo-ligase [Candidatus Saccharimonadales bacterium]|nr:5-formyltetrahydrofolate cyclo-ligase [Candidatus Saccharimonadales bacterium]